MTGRTSTWWPAGFLAIGVFTVYVLGACRTIYVGDSGELVAAAATLGVPHPSGYPLYVLLGKVWTLLISVGSIAFRMSLFSAFWAALACGMLYLLARRLTLGASTSAFVALLLAFSPSFWSQANVQRVYSLNAFFVVAVAWAACEWFRSRRPGYLVLAAFLSGLGASNHTFMGVMAGAVGLFAVIFEPRLLLDLKTISRSALAAIAGLLPYVYLPIRSRMDPRLDWGNPETLEGLRHVVLRRDFWDRAWLESPVDFVPIGVDYLIGLGEELLFAGAALALLGVWAGFRRGAPVLLPVLVMAANFVILGLHGSRSDIFLWHRYYIPSYIMAALLAGWGWQWIVERAGDLLGARNSGARHPLRFAALLLPLVLLTSGYPSFDRSRFRIAEDFSRTLLDTLPPGAHLSASDDNILFVLMYLHLVEGLRPDVNLILQGVGKSDLPALRFDPEKDPLFFTHHPNWNFPGLDLVPVGLAFKTVRRQEQVPAPALPKNKLVGEEDPRVPKDYLTENLIGHFHYMLAVTLERYDWRKAREEFEKAAAIATRNDVLFYNLGLIYRRNGLLERARSALERSHEINPRRIASRRPVRASDRLAEVEEEIERLDAIEAELRTRQEMLALQEGDAEYHRRLADLLQARGEELAARGHRLRALEASPSP